MADFLDWFNVLVVFASIIYTFTFVWFIVGWLKVPVYYNDKSTFNTKVAVILPYYNEAETLAQCLQQLVNQNINTSDYKIFAVNDFSTDNSEQIVKDMANKYKNIVSVQNTKKGKKNALDAAIKQTDADLIVTTDADCSYSEYWLADIVSYWELNKPKMIIAPVRLSGANKFQDLEFNSLIMATAGACGIQHPIMCNGANLAFCKQTYLSIPNALNNKYMSGDDMFLMHNVKKQFPLDIHFLKSERATVSTRAKSKVSSFFKQRQRWVSKYGGYSDNDTIFTALIVFLVSVLFVTGLVCSAFYIQFIYFTFVLFVIKMLVDFIFFIKTDSFFKHKKSLFLLPLFEFIYSFYVVLVALLSLLSFRKYRA